MSLPPSQFFPPAEYCDDEGLVGIGGLLTPEWLLDAYRHGIFPWPVVGDPTVSDNVPMVWWSPDPRAVIPLDRFHVPRRLRRTCRSGRFDVTFDQDFAGVIRGCATAAGRGEGETWILPEMIDAYVRLHELGHAHSVETWHEGRLAGGVYGVSIAGLFAGESMFHAVRDASKVALVCLVEHLCRRGYVLFDIQQFTSHVAQFGACELVRREYLSRLETALALPVSFR